MHKKFLPCIIILFLLFGNIMIVSAPIVDIGMETDKQIYNVGDPVRISGNVTADGVPVNDALVAIEILSPYGSSYVIRTVKTGEIPSGYWKVQILNLYTCDSVGNPKTLFNKGAMAYVFISIKSNDTYLTHHVKVALYTQYSDNSPLIAYYPFEIDVEPGHEIQNIASLPIPTNAQSGEAVIFVSLFSDTPANAGTAYCPEKTASFYIASTTPPAQPQLQYFNITFKMPKKDVKLGNYMIYARSMYQNSLATEIKSFEVILVGDVVKDGKIDMRDIGAVCNLYGTKEGDPNWNPAADVTNDKKVDMRDIGIVCHNYGKTAIY